ncbi:MAG: DNA helicase UvrD [Candidatus Goldbacteria bacterium]|nr:DNA helicase UvrD [Candidatus Goldiibacteriota bacterium]
MRIIADFHVHSKYSRATSASMNPVEISEWADKKGISVIGTGDFQHPAYLGELKNRLEEAEPGLYKVKKSKFKSRMVLSTEISHIYKQGEKVRKVHMLVIMPDMLSAEKFSKKLATLGNTGSDGRPILGFPAKDLVKLTLDIAPDAMVIPAHIWTPWFSVFGSKSGFDSLEECFEEQTKYIRAVETGLSSDAVMNHRVSALDNIALISNSDAHSPRKIGREANVFECALEYKTIKNAIYKKDKKKFLYTIEFFPEEGKYHNDGHRLCGINYHPKDAIKNKNICPVCKKPLVLGVLHRVEELADRPWDYVLKGAIPQKHIIPLEEIIADVKDVSPSSKKVQEAYEKMLVKGGSEFEILLDRTPEELNNICDEKTAQAIMLVRQEKVNLIPGFDGEFGKISIFKRPDSLNTKKKKPQMDLF